MTVAEKKPAARRSPLQIVNDAINDRLAKAAKLDAEIETQDQAEHAAVAQAVATPSKTVIAYAKNGPAWAAREAQKKAREARELLQREIDALYVQRQAEEAAAAVVLLDEKAAEIGPLVADLRGAYAETAVKLAEVLSGPWQTIAAAFDKVNGLVAEVERSALPAAAAADADAAGRWNAAKSSVGQFSPAPSSVGHLVELVVGALIDPHDSHGGTVNHLQAALHDLIPDDVANLNVPAHVVPWGAAGGDFGSKVLALARRVHAAQQSAAEPPPPTDEQVQAAKDHANSVLTKWRAEQAKRIEAAVRKNNYASLSEADRAVLASRQGTTAAPPDAEAAAWLVEKNQMNTAAGR